LIAITTAFLAKRRQFMGEAKTKEEALKEKKEAFKENPDNFVDIRNCYLVVLKSLNPEDKYKVGLDSPALATAPISVSLIGIIREHVNNCLNFYLAFLNQAQMKKQAAMNPIIKPGQQNGPNQFAPSTGLRSVS